MRVLFISPVPRWGAGCRARIEQYLPYLRAAGIHGRVRPFMTNRFFRIAYQPGRRLEKIGWMVWCSVNRLFDLARALRYDVIVIYRECVPFGPPLLEWCLARLLGKPIVYDLDDAIHLPSPTTDPGRGWKRWMKCYWKVPVIIRWSRVVVVCNDYLADYARRFHAQVVMIPTAVETNYFTPRLNGAAPPAVPVIGWMGTHSTAPYLEMLVPVLQRLAQRHAFEVRLIGAGRRFEIDGVRLTQSDWALAREVADLQAFDIGIYPLGGHEFDKGKTGYKTVQYMAVGVPAVVSDFGRNREIVRDGENGLLAGDAAAWEAQLARLLEDPALRRRIGATGRRTVEAIYATAVNAPKLIAVLRAVSEGRAVEAYGSMHQRGLSPQGAGPIGMAEAKR